MKRYFVLSALATCLLLPGCTEEKKEVKTVQWYTDHPQERAEQLKICANNSSMLNDDPNYINAKHQY